MRGHTHHGAVAVAHEHVVTDPHLDLLARQRVGYKQSRALTFFLLRGEFGFCGAARLAFFNEGGKRGVAQRRMHSQWVLRRDRTKRHAHDGVSACGEDIHQAVANQRAGVVLNVVRECKANAFALANPVLLHQLDALWPTR